MPNLDRQHFKASPAERLAEECLKRLLQGVLAHADLDGDLPVTCRADELCVRRVQDVVHCPLAQPPIAEHEPQESVRIQEQLHGMYSAKSRRCSSSSLTTVSIPWQQPNSGN